MKTKLLKRFKKYWDYYFTKDGGVITKRKCDDHVRVYTSVSIFINNLAMSDEIGIQLYSSHKKKMQRIDDLKTWNKFKP